MKDQFAVRRRRNNKIKLLVSFNGAFRLRPPAGRLRYTGGETKIISVDRSLGFSRLKARVVELLEQSDGVAVTSPFSLTYLLPDSREERPLVSVSSEDDVRSMIQEFERLEFLGKPTRLWIFVCFDCYDGYSCFSDNGFVQKKVFSVKTSGVGKSGSEGLGGEILMTREKGKKLSDNSLRKIVLKQQWLGKKSDRIRCFKGDIQPTEMDFVSENGSSEHPVIDISSLSVESGSFSPAGEFYKVNVLDYEYKNSPLVETDENFKKVSTTHGHKSHALNPKDGNLLNGLSGHAHSSFERGDGDASYVKSPKPSLMSGIEIDTVLCNVNRENIMPFNVKGNMEHNRFSSLSSSLQLNGSGNPPAQGSQRALIGSCEWISYFGSSETRSSRIHPYQTRTRDIFSEMDNFHNVRLDGISYIEKYYTAMRMGRNISKHLSISHVQRIKDVEGKMNLELNEYGSGQEVLVEQDGQEPAVGAVQETIASAVDAALNNLSLSSSIKEELQSSSPARSDITKSLVKTQSRDMELMDEEDLSSSPPLERSNGASSKSLVIKTSQELNNVIKDKSPNDDEKDENRETRKSAKVNGAVPAGVIRYCTPVGNRGLQSIKKSELEYVKELGSGTYGTVYYGKWKGSDVAIKRLKPSCFTEGTVENRLVADFWKEAHILGGLHHPNIVALYGVVTDGPMNNLATVTEYMVNGSLKQVLRKRDRTIDCRKRLIIAMDAAFGMEYLHQKNVVHFDLKSHNFLVNMRDPQRPVCKIGDLGLSKVKQRTFVSGGVRGTIPWMAPELLNGESMVSEKVDVYSFGIVMWELLTGEEPYSNMRAEEIICGIIEGSLRPEIPNWCNPAWRSLMERCWSSDPKARPAFSDVAKELRAMASAMNIK